MFNIYNTLNKGFDSKFNFNESNSINENFESTLKEEMEIFHNSNGIDYEVLERSASGENALLKSTNPKALTPYIVAWNCPKGSGSWGQGHYFQYEQDARELWNSDYVNESLQEADEYDFDSSVVSTIKNKIRQLNDSLDEGLMSYEDIWGQTEEDPYEVAKQFNLTCEKIPCSDCASDETKYKFSGKPADFEKARKAGFFYSIDFDESLKENYDEDLFYKTWLKLPTAVKDTMNTGWLDSAESEMGSTRYAKGYIQALVDCRVISENEADNFNIMNDEEGNYVRESLRLKISEQLNRLQEKEMSDEDKKDNELLRSILQKTSNRTNAKLTPDEQAVLDKYDLYRDGYKGSSWIGQHNLGHIADQMDGYSEYNPNINLADRARKWKDRQDARNIRNAYNWENPDPKNMSNGEYAATFQDKDRETDAFLMHEPVRNMKNALRSKQYHQNELNNIDTKYQAELDRLNKRHEFDKKYHQDSVNYYQKDIDKLLKRNKNNSEEK